MSMKNPLTAGIEPATFRFVTQQLNHYATAIYLPHFITTASAGVSVAIKYLVISYNLLSNL
jgi:hypothetical protein